MFDKEEKETPKLFVSDEFLEIYKNFNVCAQIEQINKLSDRERFLLLILCLDKHDDDNPIVLYNFKPFKEEIKEIYVVQDNKETTNQVLLDLIKETDHRHIESDYIRDKDGSEIPDPFDKHEVRDKKIDLLKKVEIDEEIDTLADVREKNSKLEKLFNNFIK